MEERRKQPVSSLGLSAASASASECLVYLFLVSLFVSSLFSSSSILFSTLSMCICLTPVTIHSHLLTTPLSSPELWMLVMKTKWRT